MPAFDPVRDAAQQQHLHPPPLSPNHQRRTSSLASILNDDPDLDDYLRSPLAERRPSVAYFDYFDAAHQIQMATVASPALSRHTLSPALSHHTPSSSRPSTAAPPPLPHRTPTPPPIPYDPVRISSPKSILVPLSPRELDSLRDRSRNWLRKGVSRPGHRASAIPPTPSAPPQRPPLTDFSDADGIGYYTTPAIHPTPTENGAYSPSRPTPTKRVREAEEPSPREPPKKKRAMAGPADDKQAVAGHYNARPDVGRVARRDSPIIALKNFNNWVKSVEIHLNCLKAGYKVLDMGCGKGGDLQKWGRAKVKEYVGVDVAEMSVDQARERWETMRGPRFDATFAALDCFAVPLSDALPRRVFDTKFDIVSMQFCAHYAFRDERSVRMMLQNATSHLRVGGKVIGTIPNAEQILTSLAAVAPRLTFGNDVYSITFASHPLPAPPPSASDQSAAYGQRYTFFLKDAVDSVPEYLVHWPNFARLAQEYGLHVVSKRDFTDVLDTERTHPVFGPLLQRMKVVDAAGESDMDDEQWEAAGLYLAFAFEKR